MVLENTTQRRKDVTIRGKTYGRRSVDPVSGSLEVSTRDNFQCFTNIDNQGPRVVRHIIPLFIFTPNLETRDGYREEQSGETKVSMAVHTKTLRSFVSGFFDWSEESMAEVAFAGGRAVGLDIVPEVVIVELEDSGEESEKPTVNRAGEILTTAH